MINNVDSLVTVSSVNTNQSIYSIVPNFLFIDKPVVKIVGKKITKTKRLIIWFDIKSELKAISNISEIKPTIHLKDFNWQLLFRDKSGAYSVVSHNNEKEITKLDMLTIKRDSEGLVIDTNNVITYELDTDKFNGDLDFEYRLSYKNDERVGLTKNGIRGSNSGHISINESKDQYVFNNALAYFENNKIKTTVLNKEELVVKSGEFKQLDRVEKPLAEISVRNTIKTLLEIQKSEQLRAELAKVDNNGINYLQINEKGLKTVKNGDSFSVYKQSGNHYDLQTNKWVESDRDKTCYVDDDLNINIEYNHREIKTKMRVSKLPVVIKNKQTSEAVFSKYITYSNIKPNTKFNTFVANREDHLWR